VRWINLILHFTVIMVRVYQSIQCYLELFLIELEPIKKFQFGLPIIIIESLLTYIWCQ